jgi:CDP-glucose 4,6-dehydratase
MFQKAYEGKKVLITGHTGFKGSWLTVWLLKLGAQVVGFSKDIPSEPSMFNDLDLVSQINHIIGDVRDHKAVAQVINSEKPDFLFHLAAQPIVSVSFESPADTILTNAIGTMNILEVLRHVNWNLTAVMITSDKSYDNVEWVWGYKETDSLGGKDIYSGSKAAAEIILKSYYESFFKGKNHDVRLGIGRAGNVIGGGDWARDRIIVDIIRAWTSLSSVEIRCPTATRPWQHVLEPLSGYLALGSNLSLNRANDGESFNFGPRAEQNRTVVDLLETMNSLWTGPSPDIPYFITDNIPFNEAGLLKLNCDKALAVLKWHAVFTYEDTLNMTASWYSAHYQNVRSLLEITNEQLDFYISQATELGLDWTS